MVLLFRKSNDNCGVLYARTTPQRRSCAFIRVRSNFVRAFSRWRGHPYDLRMHLIENRRWRVTAFPSNFCPFVGLFLHPGNELQGVDVRASQCVWASDGPLPLHQVLGKLRSGAALLRGAGGTCGECEKESGTTLCGWCRRLAFSLFVAMQGAFGSGTGNKTKRTR